MKWKAALFAGVTVITGFVSFYLGKYQAWHEFAERKPFKLFDSAVNFENQRWILKTESVLRDPAQPLDTNRWVVTLTDKTSGQSMALLTVHPSFTKDPWDTSLKFSQTSEGFRYWSDVGSFSMKWPDIDFHYQKGFDPESGFGQTFYLGAPRY